VQSDHPFTKTRGVKSVDGESSVTALRTANAAGKKVLGAAGSIGEHGVNTLEKPRFADVDELGVARGKGHGEKHSGRDDKTARLRADPDKS
jgi:hypothetical protein